LTEPVCEVVITGDDEAWLVAFTRSLVDQRLAACGQLIRPIRSIYRWEGEVHDEAEVRVALHTRESLVPAIIKRTRTEHPYEVPCVLALPVGDGNRDYLTWVIENTGEPDASGLEPAG
jgi:periplasmic divalent cation tolerance protein